jgi:hypothetical protein
MNLFVHPDLFGDPDTFTVLYQTQYTPAENTSTPVVVSVPGVVDGERYWVRLAPDTPQASGNYWTWRGSSSDPFADGEMKSSTDAGSSWSGAGIDDTGCQITIDTDQLDILVNGNFNLGSPSPWTATNVSSVAVTGATYATSNQDSDVHLNFDPGAGGVTVISVPLGTYSVIGNQSGTNYEQAQSFQVPAGILRKIVFRLGPNVGSPLGTLNWKFLSDSSGDPGTVIASGVHTPIGGENNEIVIPGYIINAASTTYHFWLAPTSAQGSGNYWQWPRSAVYSLGTNKQTTNGGGAWSDNSADVDLLVKTEPIIKSQLDQSFVNANLVAFDCTTLKLWLKKVGSPAGTMTVRLETDDNGNATGTLVHANATATLAESGLGTSYGWATFTFTSFSMPAGIKYHIVLSTSRAASSTNYVLWGADGSAPAYADGEMKALVNATWEAESKDACFELSGTRNSTRALTGVADDYWIKFNGKIARVAAMPHLHGPLTTKVLATDLTQSQRTTSADLPLQKDKYAHELIQAALALLPQRNAATTLPGVLLDSGITRFARAFDGYTAQNSTVLGAVDDAVRSDYGIQLFDTDGTFRFFNRHFVPLQSGQAPKLTLTTGQPFTLAPLVRDTDGVWNKITVTYSPRFTVAATVVLGQITSVVEVPPVQANGTPGMTEITLTFRDPTTGQFVGGDGVITPLVAGTDYLVNEHPSGSSVDYTFTSYPTVTVVAVNATQITLRLENRALGKLYFTKLQVRGNAVTTYDPVTLTFSDATSIAKYGEQKQEIELPFNDDIEFATNLGKYTLDRYKYPFAESDFFETEWRSSINGVEVMGLELMDSIQISDTQVGMTNHKYRAIRFDYSFDVVEGVPLAGNFRCYIERQDDAEYWILGHTASPPGVSLSKLGETTRLHI